MRDTGARQVLHEVWWCGFIPSHMRIELVNQKLRLSRQEGGVLPVGRALPELGPTQPAKLVPFYPGADRQNGHAVKDPFGRGIRLSQIETYMVRTQLLNLDALSPYLQQVALR